MILLSCGILIGFTLAWALSDPLERIRRRYAGHRDSPLVPEPEAPADELLQEVDPTTLAAAADVCKGPATDPHAAKRGKRVQRPSLTKGNSPPPATIGSELCGETDSAIADALLHQLGYPET